jgi:hemerythrin
MKTSDVSIMGDPLLDAQHKVVLSYMTKLEAYFLAEKTDQDMPGLIDRLDTFCKLHLWDEERVMEEMNFPGIPDHKVQHALFIKHLENFTGRCEDLDRVKKIDELNFLKDWFIEHIEIFDKRYAEYKKQSYKGA